MTVLQLGTTRVSRVDSVDLPLITGYLMGLQKPLASFYGKDFKSNLREKLAPEISRGGMRECRKREGSTGGCDLGFQLDLATAAQTKASH